MEITNFSLESILKETPKLDAIAFAPHPDDAEIFCGGTIAHLIKLGYKVGIIDLTQGEASSRGTLETRREETNKASSILGLHYRENICIPDLSVDQDGHVSRSEQVKRVVSIIRKSQPQLVLAPYGENRHPDHQGSRQLLQDSFFIANVKSQLPEYQPYQIPFILYYMSRTEFKPSIVIDVSDSYETKKLTMKAYSSQTARNNDGHSTLVSHPLSQSSIEARDAYFGSMIGVQFGEPFHTDGPIPLYDPIKYSNEIGPIQRFITQN